MNDSLPVTAKLKGLQMTPALSLTYQRANARNGLLTREEMKNCVRVKPRVVVQIEFGEWTPDGHLRHSKFSGLRDDKDPSEVLREIEVTRSVTN